jgi:Bacteriophage baseplate protein W
MTNPDKQILGKGMVYPMGINSHRGIAMTQGEDKVRRSILTVLGTQHGERVMRPQFGCNLRSLVFAPNNLGTANTAQYLVRRGLARWEPRVELVEVTVENDNKAGSLLIQIHYAIRATGSQQSLVYPFYLESA